MRPKNIKFINVEKDVHIKGTSTFEIVEKFKQLISNDIIDTKKAVLCTINYVISSNLIENGPVKIYFTNGIRIRLNLTAGYGGTGPRDTCKILKLCDFNFNEDDILSHQEIVNLKYYKDNDEETVYQFINPDGTYEYSSL